MSTGMFEDLLVTDGGGVCLPPAQQSICVPLQVYAIKVDIRETMGSLLARAGEALTLDLTHHKVTVLGERQLNPQDTLQDQCGTRSGHVQVQFVIRAGEEKEDGGGTGVVDIVDVLKSSEEEAVQEGDREATSLPAVQPERARPTRWVVSAEFKELQKALKMPRDPRQWTATHVRVWLAWARQHFPEVAQYHHDHRDLDGAQMMSLTPSQLQQRHILLSRHGDGPSTDLFLTHRDLLRQTGAAAVCEQPPASPHGILRQTSQVTSRSESIQRSTTSTSTTTAAGSQPIQLWQFLLELLTEPKLVKVISWWGSGISGEFRLHQPEVVAALWGHRKGRPNMTYEKLSRALRYYYEGDMIAKVTGKRFVYRFVLDLKVVVGYSAAELKAQVEQCVQDGQLT